jgi:hypothetical protein
VHQQKKCKFVKFIPLLIAVHLLMVLSLSLLTSTRLSMFILLLPHNTTLIKVMVLALHGDFWLCACSFLHMAVFRK